MGLVVLDDGEQGLDGPRDLLRRMRPEAPRLRWLVTSRVRLAVDGEQVVGVAATRSARSRRSVDAILLRRVAGRQAQFALFGVAR